MDSMMKSIPVFKNFRFESYPHKFLEKIFI